MNSNPPTCKCGVLLTRLNSYVRKSGENIGGFIGSCRKCNARRYQEWRKKNPLKARIRGARYRYGMTERQYRDLLRSQDSVCAICQNPFQDPPQVDHHHGSGSRIAVRGMLCGPCNRGLGCFKDSAALLLAASFYVEKIPEFFIDKQDDEDEGEE